MEFAMKPIDKKEFLLIIIFLANILFITLPYTYKNMMLQKDINNATSNKKVVSVKSDPLKNYKIFNDTILKYQISVISKTASIEDDLLLVQLTCSNTVFESSLFTDDLVKKINNVSINSAFIDNKGNTSITYLLR